MKRFIRKLGNRGQGLSEYLILVILIAVVAITAAKGLGGTIRSKLESAQNQISKRVVVGKERRSRGSRFLSRLLGGSGD